MRRAILFRAARASLPFLMSLWAATSALAADVGTTPMVSTVPIIDTHAHLFRGRGNANLAASDTLRAMEDLNMQKTILLPPPIPPSHRSLYGARELASVARSNPGRFAFVAGGESLNPMIQATDPKDVSAESIQRFQMEAARIVKSGAVGFGEFAAEHFSSGRGNHPYESAQPDHPYFLALADIAAQSGMPIDLHMEAVPRDTPMPERMLMGPNPPQLRENISALERLLEHNPTAHVVWAHAGWDLTGERTVELMRSLLERHPNLYMSIKLDAHGPQRTSPLAPDGSLRPEWVALIRAFPDRFMIGSDQFFDEGSERLARVRQFVNALPPDIAPLVANANAKRIYRLSAQTQ